MIIRGLNTPLLQHHIQNLPIIPQRILAAGSNVRRWELRQILAQRHKRLHFVRISAGSIIARLYGGAVDKRHSLGVLRVCGVVGCVVGWDGVLVSSDWDHGDHTLDVGA